MIAELEAAGARDILDADIVDELDTWPGGRLLSGTFPDRGPGRARPPVRYQVAVLQNVPVPLGGDTPCTPKKAPYTRSQIVRCTES